jgi:GWxTD domain-containing protein
MTGSRSIRTWLLLAVCAFLLMAATIPAAAQLEIQGTSREREANEQSLFLDAVSFANRNAPGSRLDVFVQVGHDLLSFVKSGDLYDASYEMTISVLDSAGNLVSEKLWTEEVKGVTFDRSVAASAVSVTQRSFQVPFGKMFVRVVVFDKESKVSRQITREAVVPDFAANQLSISGLLPLTRVVMQGDKRSITPCISANIGAIPDSFWVYCEVYNALNLDTASFILAVLNAKGDPVIANENIAVLKPGRNELILKLRHGSLPLGDYRLVLNVRAPHAAEDAPPIASSGKNVMVRWLGLPRSVKDMDLAVEQLRYIAKDEEFTKMRDAKTPEEKQVLFTDFWKKRDPNPSTPRNEKMEEYYARIEYANKHYSHYIDGWRTDMGMVFIIFGPPSNVERHPFEVDSKPYEIWSYYELNYSILFLDETGFGDYRLQTPIWEMWQRIRN